MSYPAKMIDGELRVKVGDRWRVGQPQICWQCDMVYYRPSGLRPNEGRYCTKMCARKHAVESNARRRPMKFCDICGSRFGIKKSHYDRVKTCGKDGCKSELARRVTTARHVANREKNP